MHDGADTLPLDRESLTLARPDDHKAELRLWLRLLSATTLIEGAVRRRLRERFAVTLPRFDLMAQLSRAPQGMTLGELSQRLMVSGGNVTAIVDGLVREGWVDRNPAPHDRRAMVVRLTAQGTAAFRAMAREHGDWVAAAFDDLTAAEREMLMALLAKVKRGTRRNLAGEEA